MRLEQRVIQEAENSSVGADTESEDDNSPGAELPVLQQAPHGVFAVAAECIERAPCKRIAVFFVVAICAGVKHRYSFHCVISFNNVRRENTPNITLAATY